MLDIASSRRRVGVMRVPLQLRGALKAVAIGAVAHRHIRSRSSSARPSNANEKDELMQFSAHPSKESVSDAFTEQIKCPHAPAADRSSTGTPGAPLFPAGERPPTSLELLRQLEGFVRELFEISATT